MALLSSGKKDPGEDFQENKGLHWASPYYEEGLSKDYYSKERIKQASIDYRVGIVGIGYIIL